VPPWLVTRLQTLQREGWFSGCSWKLLDGHPSKTQLAAGYWQARTAQYLFHNVWCDQACTQAGRRGGAMMAEQLSLLSHGLEPLSLRQRVRTTAGWVGFIAQVWPGRDWYAVFAWNIPGQSLTAGLPVFRRDELEALPILDDEAERAAVAQICRPEVAQ
jgi:hypothetical protein